MVDTDHTVVLPRLTKDIGQRYRQRGWWRDRLLDSYIDEAAATHPDADAVVEADRRLTYARLGDHVTRFAQRLIENGVRPHDVVTFQLPNWIESVVVHHGIIRAGAISNPIIPIYRERELRHILTEAGSRVAVVPRQFRNHDYTAMFEGLAEEVDSLEQVWTVDPTDNQSLEQLTASSDAVELPGERHADDPAVLLYTSGTTAVPKGVVHSHNTLDYENRTIIDLYGLDSTDTVFMPSPVTHITGVLYGLQMPFMLQTNVVLQDIWEAGHALELIEAHGCTFTVAATPFLVGLVSHPDLPQRDVSSLRVFACGGADVAPELIRSAQDALGCAALRVYGSTEYPTATASAAEAPLEKRARTDGRLIADAEGRIVDELGAEVPPGEIGELLVRGPEMFLGYFGAGTNPFDEEGWFATGDLASFGEDGYLQIRGRKKDIILRGGENISAKEVEDLLFEHPDIQEVAVVAVPDPVMTERACAVVVPAPGTDLVLADITAFLEGHEIARQKFPEFLQVVDELPKTASGKIQKFKLREMTQELTDD